MTVQQIEDMVVLMNGLTDMERVVLIACIENALDATAGDFGFVDEVVDGLAYMGRQRVGGVLTSLQAKGHVNICEPYRVNGRELVHQYTLSSELYERVA